MTAIAISLELAETLLSMAADQQDKRVADELHLAIVAGKQWSLPKAVDQLLNTTLGKDLAQYGGPAFPHVLSYDKETNTCDGSPGMYLRDYFAGQAMTGLTANVQGWEATTAYIAQYAYEQADAMLAEREKK